MAHRQDTPDRTWSSDSHLLPAGIRHVARRDLPPEVRSEEPPVRPQQHGEPPRSRPPQRVRFQNSYDDYEEYERPPPRRYPGQHYAGGAAYAERRRFERAEAEWRERAIKAERELEEFRRVRRLEDEARARSTRRTESSDEYPPPRPAYRVRDGSPSPPPPLGRRPDVDVEDNEKHARRSRSQSPPDIFIKAELYSDPESYDAEPVTATSSGYGELPPPPPQVKVSRTTPLPPNARTISPVRSPANSVSESDDSDTSWDSTSDISGVYDFHNERKIYQFHPSHLSRSGSQGASTTLSGSTGDVSTAAGSSSGDKGPRGPSPDPSLGSKVVRPHRIYQSEYTGDGFPDGSHSVRLTAVLDSKRQRQPLFRWRHIQQTTMNFDELSKEVSRIGGLSDLDNHALQRLLSDVKKYSIKSTPISNGSNVKHMEPGLLQIVIDTDNAAKAGNIPARTATWLCIPYFSLQKYAGPLSGAASGSFPTRTLLQEQYSGVSAERDMQQAVCQSGHVPPGTCFHVAQMWCLVLDDSLLITCGTMPDPTKYGDFNDKVELISKPSQDPSNAVSSFIYVYYTEAVMYALPTDQCRSWFAFISHFHEFWPKTLKFTYRDSLVKPSDWPAISSTARLSNSRVLLVLKLGAAPQPPARGVLMSPLKAEDGADNDKRAGAEASTKGSSTLKPPDKGKQNATASGPAASSTPNDSFHVFSWLESASVTGGPGSQEQAELLGTQLQDVDDFLRNEVNRPDRRAYEACPEATRMDCLVFLEELSMSVKENSRVKRDFEDRVDVVNAAEVVFRFFLPIGFTGPTVGKFWGAIRQIIDIPRPDASREHSYYRANSRSVSTGYFDFTRSALRELTKEIQSFINIISHAQPAELASITVPLQLIRAWIYILLALAKATKKTIPRHAHFDSTTDLLKDGMARVMQALPSEDLLARELVLPTEVVSLLSLKLLQDMTGTYPNLDTIYSEAFDALDNEVATKPSDRSFEHRINLLKQEATIINRIVNKQRRIFATFMPPDHLREPQTVNLLTPAGPAPKKRALDEGGDYYQSYQAGTRERNNRAYYVEREKEAAKLYSAEQQRSYSRAPTFYESYAPQHAHYDAVSPQPDHAVAPPAREYYRLSPTRPGGFRDLLTTDCLSLIDRRHTAFSELFPYATYLQEYNKNKYDTTRDRQDQALYAFTIVTVVFLPLSAVAGIFGMNTADIRDMSSRQWLYWATAVPVTVAVVLIGLWWMGELRVGLPAWSSLPGLTGKRASRGGRSGYTSGRRRWWAAGGTTGTKVRDDGGGVFVPGVMVRADGAGWDGGGGDGELRMAPRPGMLRRRSVEPGFAMEAYPTLEVAGAQAGYQLPPAEYARYR